MRNGAHHMVNPFCTRVFRHGSSLEKKSGSCLHKSLRFAAWSSHYSSEILSITSFVFVCSPLSAAFFLLSGGKSESAVLSWHVDNDGLISSLALFSKEVTKNDGVRDGKTSVAANWSLERKKKSSHFWNFYFSSLGGSRSFRVDELSKPALVCLYFCYWK